MPERISHIGIGAALHVDIEKRPFITVMDQLEDSGINIVSPEDAHITLIEPKESGFPIISPRDQKALDRTRSSIGELLSSKYLEYMQLTPRSHKVERLGSRKAKVGIFIEEQEWLVDLRGQVTDIVEEETGIVIPNPGKFDGHLALGTISNEFGSEQNRKSPLRTGKIKTPSIISVKGFRLYEDADEKSLVKTPKQRRYENTRYRNRPLQTRR